MSRFKHVLMGSALAVALLAVPAVPAFARQSPAPAHTPVASAAAARTVTPDGGISCAGCWG